MWRAGRLRLCSRDDCQAPAVGCVGTWSRYFELVDLTSSDTAVKLFKFQTMFKEVEYLRNYPGTQLALLLRANNIYIYIYMYYRHNTSQSDGTAGDPTLCRRFGRWGGATPMFLEYVTRLLACPGARVLKP